jgi:hypothetical protein
MVTTYGVVLLIAAGWQYREPVQARATASSSVQSQPIPAADRPPQTLVDVGDAAQRLFDAARLSNWTDADVALRAMRESAANLPDSTWKPDVEGQLQNRLDQVGDAASARQRLQTMDFANGITRLVADLSEQYQPARPYALVLLGYYGRELELGIAAGDRARLTRAVDDLQQTWNRFERIVIQRGAVDEARRFTDIVAQLETAAAPSDFVEPTRAALDAVARLNKMF